MVRVLCFWVLFGLSILGGPGVSATPTPEEVFQFVSSWYLQGYQPQQLLQLVLDQFHLPTPTATAPLAGFTPTPTSTAQPSPTPTHTQGVALHPSRGTWNMLVQGTSLGIAAGGPVAVCPSTGQAIAPAVLMGASLQLAQTRWEGTVNQAGAVTNGKIYTVTGGGGQIGTWTGTFVSAGDGPGGNLTGNWTIPGVGASTCSGVRAIFEVTLQGVCP